YPTLQADTRTVQVRIELANPGQLLKPGMYAQVELPVGGRSKAVVIPNSAVIDSGTRRIVLVQAGEGRFEPREVRLGQRSDNQVEVLDGIKEGEAVVVTANFLIDAESNLKAAVGSFGHASHGAAPPASQGEATSSGAKPTTVGHQAEGAVEEIDLKTGAVTLNHGAIASLKWPAMSMEFQAANPALLSSVKVGMAVKFEFVERKPGEWVITRITPQQPANSGLATNPHAGH
ncbi:MAG: copper-binding protein, partial [Rhodocyclaceae bacterium]|nr:copper-binding protein [Rhodocyclaceae bacterium]